MRWRNRLAVLAQAGDVKLDCFANEFLSLFAILSDGDAAWEVRHIRTYAAGRLFEDDEVFGHDLNLSSNQPASGYFQAFRSARRVPACLRQ